MTLAKDELQAIGEVVRSIVKEEITEAEERLATRFDEKFGKLDARINGVEKQLQQEISRVDKKLNRMEERLGTKIDSQGKTLQIFIDQQLRKTNGLIEDVAEQLKITHHTVTHVLEKQIDLEERVEKLEQQIMPPL